ncbi:hypothetical protein Tco_1446560 [Tanacetum coccineum]
MCCIRVFVNTDRFQLALEFGIVTELVLLKAPYERRPSTGKCMQGPFSWGPTVGGEGACTRLTLPNVEILRPLFQQQSIEEVQSHLCAPEAKKLKVILFWSSNLELLWLPSDIVIMENVTRATNLELLCLAPFRQFYQDVHDRALSYYRLL